MAAGTLPKPGTKYGPCKDPCSHLDCEMTKRDAETKCPICNKAIGFETYFYNDSKSGGLVHAICLEDQIENESKAKETGKD